MEKELSAKRMRDLFIPRTNTTTTVRQGPFKGHSGRIFGLGLDGVAWLEVSWPHRPGPVKIEVDWLDTDLGSHTLRAAFRLRRQIARAPEAALGAWAELLPARVLNEDFGDYCFQARQALKEGLVLQASLVVIEAVAVTGWNSVLYVLRNAAGS